MENQKIEILVAIRRPFVKVLEHMEQQTKDTRAEIIERAIENLAYKHQQARQATTDEGKFDMFIRSYFTLGSNLFISTVDLKAIISTHFEYKLSQKIIPYFMEFQKFRFGRPYIKGKQRRGWFGLELKNNPYEDKPQATIEVDVITDDAGIEVDF